jgi:hypothetical protein
VEEIRRAAALMRARAQEATPNGVWRAAISNPSDSVRSEGGWEVCYGETWATLEHIASWHPAVALAVADLIDRIAWTWEIDPDLQARVGGEELLAVARAYLAGERP